MSKRAATLLQRRAQLLQEIATQRQQVAVLGARWHRPLQMADQGLALVNYVRNHPVLLGGGIVMLLVRRRGVLGALNGAWRIWKMYSKARQYSKKFTGRVLTH